MNKTVQQREPILDFLRGCSILLVLAYHFNNLALPIGYLGVDVFFVLSGFLAVRWICKSEKVQISSAWKYLNRRISRLFLPLATTVIGSFMIFRTVATPWDEINSLVDGIAALGFFSNVWFEIHTGYFEDAANLMLYLHTWSLSVEFQFYLFVFFVLLSAVISKKLAFISIFFGTTLSLVIYIYAAVYHPSPGFFYSPARFWEFGFGCLVGWAIIFSDSINGSSYRWHVFFISTILAIGLIVCLSLGLIVYLNIFTVLIVGIILLFPRSKTQQIYSTYFAKIICWFGLISFSLYLWHWPLLKIYDFLVLRDLAAKSVLNDIVVLAIIILVAFISRIYIEIGSIRSRIRSAFIFCCACIVAGSFVPREDTNLPVQLGLEGYNPRSSSEFISANFFRGLAANDVDVVIIGDSYAMDLSNVLLSKDKLLRFRSFHISSKCFLSEKDGLFSEDPELQHSCKAKIQSLETLVSELREKKVYIAMKYQSYHASGLINILSKLKQRNNVYVAETKEFPIINLRRVWFGKESVPETFVRSADLRVVDLVGQSLMNSVEVIDMMESLCRSGVCSSVDEYGRILSFDGYHLSPFGVSQISEGMEF